MCILPKEAIIELPCPKLHGYPVFLQRDDTALEDLVGECPFRIAPLGVQECNVAKPKIGQRIGAFCTSKTDDWLHTARMIFEHLQAPHPVEILFFVICLVEPKARQAIDLILPLHPCLGECIFAGIHARKSCKVAFFKSRELLPDLLKQQQMVARKPADIRIPRHTKPPKQQLCLLEQISFPLPQCSNHPLNRQ